LSRGFGLEVFGLEGGGLEGLGLEGIGVGCEVIDAEVDGMALAVELDREVEVVVLEMEAIALETEAIAWDIMSLSRSPVR
jgi:hypothetical protein